MPNHGAGLAVGLAAATFLAAPTVAEPVDYFLPPLTKGDLKMVNEATDDFLGKPAGTVEAWMNPKSGNSGTMSLYRKFKHKGQPCGELRYTFQIKSEEFPRHYHLTWCQTAQGKWKILPN